MAEGKPKNTTASIFANAKASAKNYTRGQAGPKTDAVTCQSCGAPRRDGQTSLVCSFCGGHMTRPKDDQEEQG